MTSATSLRHALRALQERARRLPRAPRVSVDVRGDVEPLEFFAAAPPLGEERVALIEDDPRRSVVGVGVAAVRYQPAPASTAAVASALRCADATPDQAPWVGGVRFDVTGTADALWAPFGAARFIRPQLSLLSDSGAHRLVLELPVDQASRARLLHALTGAREYSSRPQAAEATPAVVPAQAQWEAHVRAGLRAFADEGDPLKKAVLARRQSLPLREPLDAVALLRSLQEQAGPGAAFLLQPCAGCAFVGVSPELLARREGDTLYTEALAGTRARKEHRGDDERAQRELLESQKERSEHRFVQRFIAAQLERAGAQEVRVGEVGLRSLRRLHHLHAPITARLPHASAFGDVVGALHPTPAVAGTPREEALAFIAQREAFDRGLYAGAIGRLGGDVDALYVGIRSVLLTDGAAYVFAGAGLVAGSDPEREWREVEQKSRGAERAIRALCGEAAYAA